MNAMLFFMNAMSNHRTIYDCNIFQNGPNIIAIIGILFP